MSDHPFNDVMETAEQEIAKGHWVCQKFSCDGCGQRLTMHEANVFYTHGTCDKCGAVTDIRAKGCNYMLLIPGQKSLQRLAGTGAIKAPSRPGLTLAVTSPANLHAEPESKQ